MIDNIQQRPSTLVVVIGIALAMAVLALGALIFLPFIMPIIWAGIVALFFFPVYKRLRSVMKKHDSIASLVMCILIILFLIIPIFILMTAMTSEVIRIYNEIQENVQNGSFNIVSKLSKHPYLSKYTNIAQDWAAKHNDTVVSFINDTAKKVSEFFISQGTSVFKNIAGFALSAALMVITMFYAFRDGEQFVGIIKELLPFKKDEANAFIKTSYDVLFATLYGNIMTGLIQGALGIVILWFLDFTAPIFWGVVLGITTFIPLIGSALVWGPASIYLVLSGEYANAAILVAFSAIVITKVDIVLRPFFISGKTSLHSLVLIFAVLGGLNLFGFLGLIVGPLIVALCISILEGYRVHYLGGGKEGAVLHCKNH